MTHARSYNCTAGFTLVEALVATALMGLVLAALATITSQWLPNWSRGVFRVRRAELVDLALDRLTLDLAAAEFIAANRDTTRPLFEGDESAVTFVRSALGPNARSGLEIVRIAETADGRGPALVRARAPFVPTSSAQLRFADPVVLLGVPYRVTFSYAGKDRVWKSAWRGARELPFAVRFTIRDTLTGRTMSISSAALIHTQLPAVCASSKDDPRCGPVARRDTPSGKSDSAAFKSDNNP
jgi:general secretion pathway protein J